MTRCELILVSDILDAHNAIVESWFWLPLAAVYKMKHLEQVCLDNVCKDSSMEFNSAKDHDQYLKKLPLLTRTKLLTALSENVVVVGKI